MTSAPRIALVAVAASALAILGFPVFVRVRAGDNQIIEPQVFDYALLAVAAFLLAVGIQLAARRGATNLGLLAAIAAAGLLFGALAIFSIGLVLLPAAVLAVLLLYRALRRDPRPTRGIAAIGGALAGYGLVLAYIALIVPATVECTATGGSTSSGRWNTGLQQITGGASVTPGGVVSGRIETRDWIATYRCENGRIVEFNRVAR
jgi:hypothetical protein